MLPVAFEVCVRRRLATGSKANMNRSDVILVGLGPGGHLTLAPEQASSPSLLSLDAIALFIVPLRGSGCVRLGTRR